MAKYIYNIPLFHKLYANFHLSHFPGVEIAIKDPDKIGHTLHVNVFELDSEEFEELEAIANQEYNFKSFIRYLITHDLPHIYNHPYWFATGDHPNLWAVPELIIARKYGKRVVATTDSHTGGMGAVYTIAKGETFKEFFENIKRGKSYIVVEGGTRRHLTKELNSWVELVFSMDRNTRNEINFTTNVCSFDRIISIIANEKMNDFPRINSLAMKFFQNFSRSGFSAYIYVKTEKPLISKIEKVMNLIA